MHRISLVKKKLVSRSTRWGLEVWRFKCIDDGLDGVSDPGKGYGVAQRVLAPQFFQDVSKVFDAYLKLFFLKMPGSLLEKLSDGTLLLIGHAGSLQQAKH